MARPLVAAFLLLAVPGCSWILDFSDNAIPKDAPEPAIDGPFTQEECAYKEPNDTRATAAALAPGDTGPAAICPGTSDDHDFYRIAVPAMTARVELRIAFTQRDGDLDLRLTNASGQAISQSVGFGDAETITCPGNTPLCPVLGADDYVLEVFPAVAGATNHYTIAVAFTAMTAR